MSNLLAFSLPPPQKKSTFFFFLYQQTPNSSKFSASAPSAPPPAPSIYLHEPKLTFGRQHRLARAHILFKAIRAATLRKLDDNVAAALRRCRPLPLRGNASKFTIRVELGDCTSEVAPRVWKFRSTIEADLLSTRLVPTSLTPVNARGAANWAAEDIHNSLKGVVLAVIVVLHVIFHVEAHHGFVRAVAEIP